AQGRLLHGVRPRHDRARRPRRPRRSRPGRPRRGDGRDRRRAVRPRHGAGAPRRRAGHRRHLRQRPLVRDRARRPGRRGEGRPRVRGSDLRLGARGGGRAGGPAGAPDRADRLGAACQGRPRRSSGGPAPRRRPAVGRVRGDLPRRAGRSRPPAERDRLRGRGGRPVAVRVRHRRPAGPAARGRAARPAPAREHRRHGVPGAGGRGDRRRGVPRDRGHGLEDALRAGLDPEQTPQRPVVGLPAGQLLLMPAAFGRYAGVKAATVAPGNLARGLPRIQGVYLLYDGDTLAPLAALDGIALTSLRTPAVSALAVRHLAPPDAGDLVLFGTGPQAWGHVLAPREVRPLRRITVVGRDPARTAAFAARCATLGLDSRPLTTPPAVAGNFHASGEADHGSARRRPLLAVRVRGGSPRRWRRPSGGPIWWCAARRRGSRCSPAGWSATVRRSSRSGHMSRTRGSSTGSSWRGPRWWWRPGRPRSPRPAMSSSRSATVRSPPAIWPATSPTW